MFFCSITFTNSGLTSALSRMKTASGFSSSTFLRYCSLRSGKDFIGMPLPRPIAFRKIRNAHSPSTSLSKKNRGFCEASRCCLISPNCSWVSILEWKIIVFICLSNSYYIKVSYYI